MGLILDTNALSAIAEGDSGAVEAFVRARRVTVPVIVLGEYRFGIANSRHREEYERWLQQVVSICPVLEVNEQTAACYARVGGQLREAGTPIPSNDVWIAALCEQHVLPILSRDRHFDLVKGLRRIEW
jgi:tRNA(fMet)-specific endonuclease VapC